MSPTIVDLCVFSLKICKHINFFNALISDFVIDCLFPNLQLIIRLNLIEKLSSCFDNNFSISFLK